MKNEYHAHNLRYKDPDNPEMGFERFDPEQTVEFDPIEQPLTKTEQELVRSLDPDQLVTEGLSKAIETWGMGI